jgi:hypothetical protein
MLLPAGIAEIDGERVEVESEGELIEADTAIVSRADGNRIVVRRQRIAASNPAGDSRPRAGNPTPGDILRGSSAVRFRQAPEERLSHSWIIALALPLGRRGLPADAGSRFPGRPQRCSTGIPPYRPKNRTPERHQRVATGPAPHRRLCQRRGRRSDACRRDDNDLGRQLPLADQAR